MRRRLHTSGSLGISQCIAGLPGNAHLLYACAELSCVNSPLPFLPPLPSTLSPSSPLPLSPYTNRHIYNPLVSMGVGKLGAQISVFILSAAFHEVTFDSDTVCLTGHVTLVQLSSSIW